MQQVILRGIFGISLEGALNDREWRLAVLFYCSYFLFTFLYIESLCLIIFNTLPMQTPNSCGSTHFFSFYCVYLFLVYPIYFSSIFSFSTTECLVQWQGCKSDSEVKFMVSSHWDLLGSLENSFCCFGLESCLRHTSQDSSAKKPIQDLQKTLHLL